MLRDSPHAVASALADPENSSQSRDDHKQLLGLIADDAPPDLTPCGKEQLLSSVIEWMAAERLRGSNQRRGQNCSHTITDYRSHTLSSVPSNLPARMPAGYDKRAVRV